MSVDRLRVRELREARLIVFPLFGILAPLSAFLIVTAQFVFVAKLGTSQTQAERRGWRHMHADATVRLELRHDRVDVWYDCERVFAIALSSVPSFLRDLKRRRAETTAIDVCAPEGGVAYGDVIHTADLALQVGFTGVFIEHYVCDPSERWWNERPRPALDSRL